MQLSDQVITLEQAQKLKELWFEIESIFQIYNPNWNIPTPWSIEYSIWWDYMLSNLELSELFEKYPAYTVSELMEYLPSYIWDYCIGVFKDDIQYCCHYVEVEKNTTLYQSRNDNLSQALWDILIYLIENKYIQL